MKIFFFLRRKKEDHPPLTFGRVGDIVGSDHCVFGEVAVHGRAGFVFQNVLFIV